jgi:ATP-dependent helicase/nuclease subunit A
LSAIPAKLTATQLTADSEGQEKRAELLEDHATKRQATFRRPRFAAEEIGLTPAQKGTALHTVLQCIQLDRTNSIEDIQNEINRLATELYITSQEAEIIHPRKLYQFFSSPVGQELKEAETLHREFPFSILVPAKAYFAKVPEEETLLLQGVIDCWFETSEGITLLDFKSNHVSEREVEAKAEQYREQIDAYAHALEEMTSKPVIRKIVWFLTPNCGVNFGKDGTIKKT